MSWITIVWSMTAAACLTLALIHCFIWLQNRVARANLLFALSAVGTAGMAACELWIMRAETPDQFSVAVRWLHIPAWIIVVSLVGFVRFYLRAGRPWLAWTICALRTLSLALNFILPPNLNYREITALRRTPFFGEYISTAKGVSNSWMLIGQLSLFLLLIFVIDAAISVWQRGERRRAIFVGGSTVFFVTAASVQAVLVFWGIIDWPMTASFFYMGVIAAMAYELSGDVFVAARLAQELRESENRFRTMADTAPVMIWMSGPDKLCTFFNKSWLNFTGRTLEQEQGNGWAEGVHRDDHDRCLDVYVTSFDARRAFLMEYRLRRSDGEYRWVLDNGVPRFETDGTFLGYIGSNIDITERKRAEEKFRLAVEASPSAIVMLNHRRRIVLINGLTEKIFGYSREELTGQSVDMLVPERFRASHPEHRADFFASPQSRAMDAGRNLFARRKDGSEFPVEIGLNPIQTAEGVLVLAAIVDITERRRAEIELHRHRQEIAHVSRVSVMGELSASMAHELNQPLTAILSNAQAAQRFMAAGQLDVDEFREILKDIVFDTTRARDVIRHLRSMVKKGEREQIRLSVNEAIQQVIGFLHGDIVGRNVNVALELAPNLPTVLGDRVQLQQVLLNLLLNAFEAVNGNKIPDRHVTVITVLDSPETVLVAVRDRGAGIPADQLGNIFEPFFTTKPEGMGMGLSVSRSIIEAHGGDLRAENNPDCGATVFFTLPVGDASSDRAQAKRND